MIKDAVVNLPIGMKDTGFIDYAVSLARAFRLHLSAVAFAYEPIPAAMLMDNVPPDFIEEQQEEAEQNAKAALAMFEKASRRSGISTEARSMNASFGGTADIFGQIARRYDLSIVRQAEPDRSTPDDLLIEAALFDSGRPVLVVPYIQEGEVKLDRILVCWDGSRNSARAVGDALPLLQRAKAVEVVSVGDRLKSTEMPGADITQHLARHGIAVDVKHLVAADIDAASAVLSHASDSGADVMVMGGYGHSRLREFVLGGFTRSMLASMTIPALMAH